jgi:SAM-dependent methyltransferase
MIALTDCRIDAVCLDAIKENGIDDIITLPPADYLHPSVSSHTDMLIFIGFGKIFCHYEYYTVNKALIDGLANKIGASISLSQEPTGAEYPRDVLFNACLVGNNLICNTKTVSHLILDAAVKHGCRIIHVPQGYSKCSVCIVSDEAIITSDKAIYKTCNAAGIDVLLVREGHISLTGMNYGFIGGASGVCGDKVFFCGNIDLHPDAKNIKAFCQKHKKTAVSLSDEELNDVGSIFFINSVKENMQDMDKSYWNEKYWVRHMRDDDLNNIEDNWVEKYTDTVSQYSGKLLDLGCGVGQYSAYFADRGFDVTAADISERALAYLAERSTSVNTVQLDMTQPLPFTDKSFDVVFANLSIHFFSEKDTENLIGEIRRILKDDGIFIGSCNSSKAYKYIADKSTVIENNFYLESGGRCVRLFDRAQFEYFFKEWNNVILCEVETQRFNKSKTMWEFIYKK